MTRRARALVLVLVLVLAPASGAAAATCPKASLPDVEDEVMCLQCGVPLNVAEDAPSAKRERAFIQAAIERCESKRQIKDQLVAQFGDRILAEPDSSSAWLIPALAAAAGLVGVATAAWTWRRRRTTTSTSTSTSTPDARSLSSGDSARLDADLERYDL